MFLLWWCPFKIRKEKRAGLQFTSTDYLSIVLTPVRIRWTVPLSCGIILLSWRLLAGKSLLMATIILRLSWISWPKSWNSWARQVISWRQRWTRQTAHCGSPPPVSSPGSDENELACRGFTGGEDLRRQVAMTSQRLVVYNSRFIQVSIHPTAVRIGRLWNRVEGCSNDDRLKVLPWLFSKKKTISVWIQ